MANKYLSVESPDNVVTVDFLSAGCTVKLEVGTDRKGNKTLYVRATADDYRCSIFFDEEKVIPSDD